MQQRPPKEFLLCSSGATWYLDGVYTGMEMAFHVGDPETDAFVRRLAVKNGVGITDAIREAALNELAREEQKLSLWERTADIRAELNANADPNFTPDKAFYDWLSGEEDRCSSMRR